MLVTNGEVNGQAKEDRYNNVSAYRSAIGTKNGKGICFAVSEDKTTMAEWAQRLQGLGYQGAINLDGGPYSQMAVRENNNVITHGNGNQKSRVVIFSYKK